MIGTSFFSNMAYTMSQAQAQAPVALYCWNPTGSGLSQWVPCNATTPLEVHGTFSFTPSGTQNVNLTQVLGAEPSLTNPLWVFPATGATFPVSAASLPLPNGAATAANQIVGSGYGNQANFVAGVGSTTQNTITTIIAAPVAGKLYITGVQCFRNDAGTTPIFVTLNDSVATVVGLPNSGGGGGNNPVYQTPLVVQATTALRFTPSASITTVTCNAQGYNAT